ncbi:MAG: hypothetical protein KGJ49_13000 [Alphaproteobacteria bacterium]|nr:hypothetical protein [Alphaproteobacteria bacterium]
MTTATPGETGNDFPPGLVGEIAQFIYDAAPRPVAKIALAGAIGLFAGITGRAYNVSGTGLNQYIIIIAETGRGKEAASDGIDALMEAVAQTAPTATQFKGPTEIASAQAILKWLADSPCIYCVVGELGLKLKEMSEPHAPAHVAGLKRALLNLYSKSKKTSKLGAMAYSKREENTPVISAPAFTLLGETTPQVFFENISEGLISNGVLPRFLVIEYTGKRVPLCKAHNQAIPSPDLVVRLAGLVAHCAGLNAATGQVHDVRADTDADAIFDRFNEYADAQINDDNECVAGRELWNRAHLKALKLAALVAVGVNPHFPTIDAKQAQWACNQIHAQTIALRAKFTNGEVGAVEDNENLRRKEIIKAMFQYATTPFEKLRKYGISEKLHSARVIPQSYLQRRLGDTAAFRKARYGATKAITTTLQNMRENDELREIPRTQMVQQFGTYARAFMISKPEVFLPDEN